jgi:foldase protein PrsA
MKIKKYISMAIAGVMLFSFAGCDIVERTPESIGKTVLAKVNDEKITRADVDKLMTYQLNNYKQQYGDDFENNSEIKDTLKQARKSALDNLINQKVLLSKKADLGIDISDEDLQSQVDEQISGFKQSSGSDDAYVQLLTQYGYTEDEFVAYMKDQIVLSKISEKMTEDVTASDDEQQSYYKDNLDSFKVNAGATVTHIVFTDATKGEAEAKAARELIVSGKSFDDIKAMDQYKSDDTVKVEQLGHQDFENNSSLVTEFVTAFKALKVNEISQPVKTSYGWHIIKNTAVNTEAYTPSFEEAKAQVETTVLNKKKEEQYQSKLEEFKSGMDIKTYDDRY